MDLVIDITTSIVCDREFDKQSLEIIFFSKAKSPDKWKKKS